MNNLRPSLIVLSYRGHLRQVPTRNDVERAKLTRRERMVQSIARYSPACKCEGHTIDETGIRKRGLSELPEALQAGSELIPIENAHGFARWIDPADAEKIAQIDKEIDALKKKRDRLVKAAYANGRPISPEEVRTL